MTSPAPTQSPRRACPRPRARQGISIVSMTRRSSGPMPSIGGSWCTIWARKIPPEPRNHVLVAGVDESPLAPDTLRRTTYANPSALAVDIGTRLPEKFAAGLRRLGLVLGDGVVPGAHRVGELVDPEEVRVGRGVLDAPPLGRPAGRADGPPLRPREPDRAIEDG
jgi:hypothetical protein